MKVFIQVCIKWGYTVSFSTGEQPIRGVLSDDVVVSTLFIATLMFPVFVHHKSLKGLTLYSNINTFIFDLH